MSAKAKAMFGDRELNVLPSDDRNFYVIAIVDYTGYPSRKTITITAAEWEKIKNA